MKNSKNQQSEPIKGLYRYCTTCRKWLKQGQECEHNWFYRILIRSKQGKLRSKNLKKELNHEELIREVEAFRKLVHSESVLTPRNNFNLSDEVNAYRDYLNDVGVAEKEKKNHPKKYINDQMRIINWFEEFINGLDKKDTISNVIQRSDLKEQFIKYLKNKSISDNTIINSVNLIGKWFRFMLDIRKQNISNPWITASMSKK